MPDTTPNEAFYNVLELSLEKARNLIAEGSDSRRAASHHPVVATIDGTGLPSQRIMILRELDWGLRTLRFHTDARTTKVGEIALNCGASVLFYEPEPKIQLRLTGTAEVQTSGPEANRAWEEATNFARRCYMAEAAPGLPVSQPVSGLPKVVEGRQPTDEELIPARENFAIMLFHFDKIEWLYLANSGHRRARWNWDSASGCWTGSWLIP